MPTPRTKSDDSATTPAPKSAVKRTTTATPRRAAGSGTGTASGATAAKPAKSPTPRKAAATRVESTTANHAAPVAHVNPPPPVDRDTLIRAKAYELYLQRGWGGSEVDDWLEAERQVDALLAGVA